MDDEESLGSIEDYSMTSFDVMKVTARRSIQFNACDARHLRMKG
jgi:hypothetical protein